MTNVDQSIPLKLWQTYKDTSALSLAEPYIESWRTLNPDYSYSFMVDDEIDTFIHDHFDRATLDVFRALPLGVMRADMWRYAVLYIEGGVYADLDAECLIPINEWGIPRGQLVVGLEKKVHFCQWCIASVAKHSLLATVLEMIVARWQDDPDLSRPNLTHYLTGPGIWTEAIARYSGATIGSAHDIYRAHQDNNNTLSLSLLNEQAFNNQFVRHHYGSTTWRESDNYVSWTSQSSKLHLLYGCYPTLLSNWTMQIESNVFRLHSTNGASVELNDSARVILSYCDGSLSVANIAELIANDFEIPTADISESIWKTLNDLAKLGVVDIRRSS